MAEQKTMQMSGERSPGNREKLDRSLAGIQSKKELPRLSARDWHRNGTTGCGDPFHLTLGT
jgi:hypothetical protein